MMMNAQDVSVGDFIGGAVVVKRYNSSDGLETAVLEVRETDVKHLRKEMEQLGWEEDYRQGTKIWFRFEQ
jgi:hypothetical protein